jgi:putative endonuclease
MDVRNKIATGQAAELLACSFLEKKGLQLLHRNYRCLRGEIDLIMQDQDDIVFVEVRMRSKSNYGSAIESIDLRKQTKIIAAATYYLCQKNWFDKVNCRFDVIGISYAQTGATLEWIRDAFHADNF